MCGITGFWALKSFDGRAVLEAMCSAIAHRGPDAQGTKFDLTHGVALGHRRLSIVELSPAGAQPMASASGRYLMVFNGEVFNFEEIRRELEGQGRSPAWKGRSDTEVMLAAIEAFGLRSAVERFVGMFAFALWDTKEAQLHLVRDRLGIKPLYVAQTPAGFCFGSELKALRKFPGFDTALDAEALGLYLARSNVPAPHTIYRAARKLLPGEIVTYAEARLDAGKAQAYWSARDVARQGIAHPFSGTEVEAVDALDGWLRKSVELRRVADVPLGAFLSGGIDSSTVVALMQSLSSRPVLTFSIENEDAAYDESHAARAVAAHLGTEHHPHRVLAQEALDVVPRLAAMYDEPFADSSQIPTYLVSKLARAHVTVALSGDGGDELFGGYNRHVWAPKILRSLAWVPASVRVAASQLLTQVSEDTYDRAYARFARVLPSLRIPGQKVHKLAGVLAASTPRALHAQLAAHWRPEDEVLRQGRPGSGAGDADLGAGDDTQAFMYRDLVEYLPDTILTKVDRASMAVSLEARVPLLDHRVVEFAWSLPTSMKVKGLTGKWLLRQVLKRYVPDDIVSGPKMGFGIPLGPWLKGPLRPWAEELLAKKRLDEDGIFSTDLVRQRWDELQAGVRPWEHHLWSVLMFQAWKAHA